MKDWSNRCGVPQPCKCQQKCYNPIKPPAQVCERCGCSNCSRADCDPVVKPAQLTVEETNTLIEKNTGWVAK